MAKKKIQNSNYSCDDNVTNFVKFMKMNNKLKKILTKAVPRYHHITLHHIQHKYTKSYKNCYI